MLYLTDGKRHLVCLPYSEEDLHKMADDLGIGRHWFHRGKYPHYDIPKKRIDEIENKCYKVTSKLIIKVIKGDIKCHSQLQF